MQVKYLKDGVNHKRGAVATHTRTEALVLVKLGVVKPYRPVVSVSSSPKAITKQSKKVSNADKQKVSTDAKKTITKK